MLRLAGPQDLASLCFLEQNCFVPERRESDRSLWRSLCSDVQEVWLAEAGATVSGAMILRLFPRTLRLYSVAVDPAFRGKGIGDQLLSKAVSRAEEFRVQRMILEVDASDTRLILWYHRWGFGAGKTLPDYYGPGMPALRMERTMEAR